MSESQRKLRAALDADLAILAKMHDPEPVCIGCDKPQRVKVCVPVQVVDGADVKTSFYCESCAVKKGLGTSIPAMEE